MGYLVDMFRSTEEENRNVILSLLERDQSARLLDLGCNDGSLTLRLADAVGTPRISGVEVVAGQAASARARGIHVVEADLNQRLPLADASFDVVHSNQVIEHLHDTDRFASEIKRILAPGGYAVISTNNLGSLHNIISLLLGQQPPCAHVSGRFILGNSLLPLGGTERDSAVIAHLRIFGYRAMREFFLAHGLRCETYRTVGFYPFPPSVARVLCRVAPIYGAFLTCRLRHA